MFEDGEACSRGRRLRGRFGSSLENVIGIIKGGVEGVAVFIPIILGIKRKMFSGGDDDSAVVIGLPEASPPLDRLCFLAFVDIVFRLKSVGGGKGLR
jgi:hypothetical protein